MSKQFSRETRVIQRRECDELMEAARQQLSSEHEHMDTKSQIDIDNTEKGRQKAQENIRKKIEDAKKTWEYKCKKLMMDIEAEKMRAKARHEKVLMKFSTVNQTPKRLSAEKKVLKADEVMEAQEPQVPPPSTLSTQAPDITVKNVLLPSSRCLAVGQQRLTTAPKPAAVSASLAGTQCLPATKLREILPVPDKQKERQKTQENRRRKIEEARKTLEKYKKLEMDIEREKLRIKTKQEKMLMKISTKHETSKMLDMNTMEKDTGQRANHLETPLDRDTKQVVEGEMKDGKAKDMEELEKKKKSPEMKIKASDIHIKPARDYSAQNAEVQQQAENQHAVMMPTEKTTRKSNGFEGEMKDGEAEDMEELEKKKKKKSPEMKINASDLHTKPARDYSAQNAEVQQQAENQHAVVMPPEKTTRKSNGFEGEMKDGKAEDMEELEKKKKTPEMKIKASDLHIKPARDYSAQNAEVQQQAENQHAVVMPTEKTTRKSNGFPLGSIMGKLVKKTKAWGSEKVEKRKQSELEEERKLKEIEMRAVENLRQRQLAREKEEEEVLKAAEVREAQALQVPPSPLTLTQAPDTTMKNILPKSSGCPAGRQGFNTAEKAAVVTASLADISILAGDACFAQASSPSLKSLEKPLATAAVKQPAIVKIAAGKEESAKVVPGQNCALAGQGTKKMSNGTSKGAPKTPARAPKIPNSVTKLLTVETPVGTPYNQCIDFSIFCRQK
ncbi:calponin homology domain-containing protein DDB_G0272472-like [Engraulis encrasicolus]|uniref:calponin homology domain-containing protein DDB_G0272472-like n=1 Tax=Engraulis encrasicolus TaxID=184585 RepID=UPI002FD683FB